MTLNLTRSWCVVTFLTSGLVCLVLLSEVHRRDDSTRLTSPLNDPNAYANPASAYGIHTKCGSSI